MDIQVSQRFLKFLTDWESEQYLLIGGYGSGKSYHVALKIILKLLEEQRTALVVRQVRETIRDSCFSVFKEILEKMDFLSNDKRNRIKAVATTSPMEIKFPNGSRIIFRGMDNPEKLKSINNVSIVWLEECSEIREDGYTELLGRIRTPNVSLHFFLTTNPIDRQNWIYSRFFSRTDEHGKETVIQDEEEFYEKRTLINKKNKVYYHHSILDDNPFLPKSYKQRIEALKETDIQLYVIARWGRFGATGTRVFPQFRIADNAREFRNKVTSIPSRYHFFGLDFGFETSFNALMSCCVDDENKILYIYDEVYRNHITDDKFSKLPSVLRVKERAEACEKAICADSASPKDIQYYRQQGFNMYGCKKYAGSVLQNIKKLKRFQKIICSPKCANAIREMQTLTYAKDAHGNIIYDEFNIDSHCTDSLSYALDSYLVSDLKDYKSNTIRPVEVVL